ERPDAAPAAGWLAGTAIRRRLQRRCGGGKDRFAVSVERWIDSLGVDRQLGVLCFGTGGDHLAIPALRVEGACGPKVQNRYIPWNSEGHHGLAEKVAYDVVAGEPAHGPAVLTGHHRQVSVVHPRGCDITCGEHVLYTDDMQIVVHRNAAETIAV